MARDAMQCNARRAWCLKIALVVMMILMLQWCTCESQGPWRSMESYALQGMQLKQVVRIISYHVRWSCSTPVNGICTRCSASYMEESTCTSIVLGISEFGESRGNWGISSSKNKCVILAHAWTTSRYKIRLRKCFSLIGDEDAFTWSCHVRLSRMCEIR